MQKTNKHKQYISPLILVVGTIIYINFIITSSLSIAVIWAVCVLYIWILLTTHLNMFSYSKLKDVLCTAGILISLTIFFTHGVEELAYPEGAIIFKQTGIAKSFLLFFISSTPLYLKKQNNKTNESKKDPKTTTIIKNENWEQATLEDLESGKFESI